DWFLPSKDELTLMYDSLNNTGSFNAWYWSSSEGNKDSAWVRHFDNGSQHGHAKNSVGSVRPVRAF
ncbi:MAG: DUF1566 domain-containing protein, partial [Leptospirales bacterium]|nr:DUF1566 domain-containing protein [Leptospirales bacterium]